MMKIWHNLPKVPPADGRAVLRMESSVRERIDAARLVCVLLMIYVHVPNGQQSGDGAGTSAITRIDHWLESVFIEGPGRASAALLSVVSGYLIVQTLAKIDISVVRLYKQRFVSIVFPMFCWALLTCLVYLVLDQGRGSFIDTAERWYNKLNLVLFIYEAPYGATQHLGFLRDLFVCVLLSPLLYRMLIWLPKATMVSFALIYLFGHSVQLYIILRPLVILGFATGMLLAIRHVRVDALDRYWMWYLLFTSVFTVLIVWANAGFLLPVELYLAGWGISLQESILYPLCRLFGSLAIWCMLPMWKSIPFTRMINFFTPYLFVTFCSHFLVLSLLFNGLWMPLMGDRDAYVFLIWFMSAPVIAMGASIVMVSVAARIYPPLVTLITGGRMHLHDVRLKTSGKLLQAT